MHTFEMKKVVDDWELSKVGQSLDCNIKQENNCIIIMCCQFVINQERAKKTEL